MTVKSYLIPTLIVGFLIILYFVGFTLSKYLLVLYLLALFFDLTISAYFIFAIFLSLPFLVYFSLDAFAKSLAECTFVFLVGGILNLLTTEVKWSARIFPNIRRKTVVILGVLYFLYAIILGILSQFRNVQ